jgi:hypothetical protein
MPEGFPSGSCPTHARHPEWGGVFGRKGLLHILGKPGKPMPTTVKAVARLLATVKPSSIESTVPRGSIQAGCGRPRKRTGHG